MNTVLSRKAMVAVPLQVLGQCEWVFEYTVMDRELSACSVTKVSRKGICTISLSTFYSKPNCWIYAGDVIQEFL